MMKKIKLTDVAKLAGVSVATVSRVINHNGYASPEAKKSVLEAIQSTGYEVSDAVPAMPEKKLVGVILKKLPVNMLFYTINYSLQNEAAKKGMQTLPVFCEHVTNEVLREQVRSLMQFHICGMIISGFEENELEEETRNLLEEADIPVVFVERLGNSHGFNQICINNTMGGYLSAKYLISKGHRRILFVGRTSMDSDFGGSRLEGFKKAVEETPNPPEYYVKLCASPEPDEAWQALQEASREFPHFTAVQLWYDGFTIGALRWLYEQKLRVPNDVEVVGYDDTYSSISAPPVHTVQLPIAEMAHDAVSIIREWQDDTTEHFVRIVNLEPKLVLR